MMICLQRRDHKYLSKKGLSSFTVLHRRTLQPAPNAFKNFKF